MADLIDTGVEPQKVPAHGGRGTRKRVPPSQPPPSGPSLPETVRPTGLAPGEQPPQQGDAPDPADETAPGPGEQDQYDQVVTNAIKYIRSPQGEKALIAQMNHPTQEVYQTIAQAAVQIVSTMEKQAQATGDQVSPDALFHAGADYIIPELMQLGQDAHIFKIPPGSKTEQNQLHMALVESMRMMGLNEAKTGDHQQEAQDFMAQQIAKEADNGSIDPAFQQQAMGQNPRLADKLRAQIQPKGIADQVPQ
jgi:hypothetical protein